MFSAPLARPLRSPAPSLCRLRRRELQKKATARGEELQAGRRAHAKLLGVPEEELDGDSPVALSDEEEKILGMDATDLLQAMAKGSFTSEAVVRTYCRRALIHGGRLSATTHELYEEALEAARASDAARKKRGFVPRPLEGLPVSIKDCIAQRGTEATCGLAARVGKIAEEDGLQVQLLREAGAIPFVRSNTPQCLMLPESMNAVFGRTLNPWNLARTPGGSSGGEGALLAARATPLGLGSDIGGSIRIPSQFCGVYGFKPTNGGDMTSNRITSMGSMIPRNKAGVQPCIAGTVGPLGRSVRDLALMMKILNCEKASEVDVRCPHVPFKDDLYDPPKSKRKVLRVGYHTDHLGFFKPAPACTRAVMEAVELLEDCPDVELVRWDPPRKVTQRLCILFYSIMAAEGNMRGFMEGLDGEALLSEYSVLRVVAAVPRAGRPFLAYLLRQLGNYRSAWMIENAYKRNAAEFWDLVKEKNELIKEFNCEWEAEGLDVLLCPGLGTVAMSHSSSKVLNPAACHCFLFNILGYPAGTVPMSPVKEKEQEYEAGAFGWDILSKATREDTRGTAGLPAAVQVAARNYRDETVLRVMKLIEERLPSLAFPDL